MRNTQILNLLSASKIKTTSYGVLLLLICFALDSSAESRGLKRTNSALNLTSAQDENQTDETDETDETGEIGETDETDEEKKFTEIILQLFEATGSEQEPRDEQNTKECTINLTNEIKPVAKKRRGNKEKPHPDDPSNIKELTEVDVSQKSFDDIYSGEKPQDIEDFLIFNQIEEEILQSMLPEYKRSILLYGPTGTGKTTIASAIAADFKLRFFKFIPTKIASKWVGDSEQRFHLMLERLQRYVNETGESFVLFIDELDSFLNTRAGDEGVIAEGNSKLINLFLEFFGESEESNKKQFLSKIILLGATNHFHLIPDNVKRRFAYKTELPNPGTETRFHILKNHLKRKKPPAKVEVSDEQMKEIAQQMDQANGSDITNLIQTASLRAAKRYAQEKKEGEPQPKLVLTYEDLLEVLKDQSFGDSTEQLPPHLAHLYI